VAYHLSIIRNRVFAQTIGSYPKGALAQVVAVGAVVGTHGKGKGLRLSQQQMIDAVLELRRGQAFVNLMLFAPGAADARMRKQPLLMRKAYLKQLFVNGG
jgi:hypothetical protein